MLNPILVEKYGSDSVEILDALIEMMPKDVVDKCQVPTDTLNIQDICGIQLPNVILYDGVDREYVQNIVYQFFNGLPGEIRDGIITVNYLNDTYGVSVPLTI